MNPATAKLLFDLFGPPVVRNGRVYYRVRRSKKTAPKGK